MTISQHQRDHDREHRGERRVGLGRLLDRAARLDAIAGGQLGHDRLPALAGSPRRPRGGCSLSSMSLRTVIVGVRSRRFMIGLFRPDLDAGRSGSSGIMRPSWLVRVKSASRAGSRRSGPEAAGDHIDGANVLADLRDGDAGQQELQLLRRPRRVTGRSAAGDPDPGRNGRWATRSPQSWLTWRVFGLARITAWTSSAMPRRAAVIGSHDAEGHGKRRVGTEHELGRRAGALRAPGPRRSARAAAPSSASRASASGVRMMILAKDGSGSSGL